MKKKITLCVLILAAALLALWCLVPKNYFRYQSEKEMMIYSVQYHEFDDVAGVVSHRLDLEQLESLLFLMQVSRNPIEPQNHLLDMRDTADGIWGRGLKYTIDGMYGTKPFHILIGDPRNSYVYKSGGGWNAHKIRNSNLCLSILDGMIEPAC